MKPQIKMGGVKKWGRMHFDECACSTNEGCGQKTNWIVDHHGGYVAGQRREWLCSPFYQMDFVVDREPIKSLPWVLLRHKPFCTNTLQRWVSVEELCSKTTQTWCTTIETNYCQLKMCHQKLFTLKNKKITNDISSLKQPHVFSQHCNRRSFQPVVQWWLWYTDKQSKVTFTHSEQRRWWAM